MTRHVKSQTTAALVACLASMAPLKSASAVELIKDLDCALVSTTHAGSDYCLKVVNTCNTPIVSRIQENGGVQKDSAQVPPRERTKLCTTAPFTFLGSYIAGPLAQGAGD